MSFLRPIWQDLKAKRLLPVAAVLLVAIVAVPIVLSGSSSAPPSVPPGPAPGPVANGLPAVNDTALPSNSAPTGHARDPFAPVGGSSSASKTTTTTTTTAAPGTTTTPTTPSGSGGGGGSTTTSGGSSPTTTTPSGSPSPPGPPTIPVPKPKHTIPTLKPDQSYSVSLAITNPAGGLDTINPLQRLSPLPGPHQPLLVELGVLRGGSRVLFAVQPGTVVSGQGTCIPGPIDCEILSVAQAQTERLSVRSAKGLVRVAMFAVTAITAANHASRTGAMKARNQESSVGRRVLDHSSLKALRLFRYEPATGSVADLRNLTLRK